MSETKNQEEPTFMKRKSELNCQDKEVFPVKSQKFQILVSNSAFEDDEDGKTQESKEMLEGNSVLQVHNVNSCASSRQEHQKGNDGDMGLSEADHKGKGIARCDDKGKEKMTVEKDEDEDEDEDDSDEDDDDDSDDGDVSDGDSDLSDDPLAEVDLDNILPSRTRRSAIRSGINISDDLANDADDEDDDDSEYSKE